MIGKLSDSLTGVQTVTNRWERNRREEAFKKKVDIFVAIHLLFKVAKGASKFANSFKKKMENS